MKQHEYLTVKEAAVVLGIKPTGVYQARFVRKLNPDKDESWNRGQMVFHITEIKRYMSSRAGGSKRKSRPFDVSGGDGDRPHMAPAGKKDTEIIKK